MDKNAYICLTKLSQLITMDFTFLYSAEVVCDPKWLSVVKKNGNKLGGSQNQICNLNHIL